MLRTRFAVSAVAAAAALAFGAVAAAGSGDGAASVPPPTQPRPTAPPLTAPVATVTVTTLMAAPTTVAATADTAGSQEPTGHEEDPSAADDAGVLTPQVRAAVLATMGLDEASFQCLASAVGGPIIVDDTAAATALQSCGIPVAAFVDGAAALWARGQQALDGAPAPSGSAVDQIPPDDAFFVGLLFLVPSDGLECLADAGLGPAATDDEALAALTACEAPISGIVSGIMLALIDTDDLSGPPATTAPAVTAPPVAPSTAAASPSLPVVPTVPGPTAAPGVTSAPVPTGVPLDDPSIAVVQQLFADQGITLSPEQASCVVGGLNSVNVDNMASMAALLDSCQVF